MTGSVTPIRPEDLLAEYSWLQGLASSLVADRHLAEDAVHETCVRALRSEPRDRSRMRQWLSSIMRNFVKQQARSDSARGSREVAMAHGKDPQTPSTLDLVERVSTQQVVVNLVLGLDDVYREVVLLRFFEGLPQRAIAERLAVPVATVNSRLTRALQKIRGGMDQAFGQRRAWLTALVPVLGPKPVGLSPVAPLGILLMQAKLQFAAAALVITGLVYFFWPESEPTFADHSDASRQKAVEAQVPGAERPTPETGISREEVETTKPDPDAVGASKALASVARGVVVSPDGSPVAGVPVGFKGGAATETVESDAQGKFEIPLSSENTHLVAKSPDYVTVLSGAPSADRAFETVLVVAPPIAIGGQVVSTAGRAIVGARVAVQLPDDFESKLPRVLDRSRRLAWTTESGEDGRFAIPSVPGIAQLRMLVTRAPFDPHEKNLTGHSDDRIYVVLGAVEPEDGPAIVGRVVDSSGDAVPDARVASGLTMTASDANGNFRILHKRAGKPESIRAIKPGYALAKFTPEPSVTGEIVWPQFVELQLTTDTKSIRGRVVDAAGKPLAGALVWTPDAAPFGVHGMYPVSTEYLSAGGQMPRTEPLPDDRLDAPLEGDEEYGGMWHAKETSASWFYETTDDDGRFELKGLGDKRYRVRAMNVGTTLMATSDPVAAGSAGVEVKMRKEDAHDVVSGVMVLPNGDPAPGVSISVFAIVFDTKTRVPGGTFHGELIRHGQRTKTDKEGRFGLKGTPAQNSRLSIYGDGIIPRFFVLPGDSDLTDLRIPVTPRYHLEVILTAADSATHIRGENDGGGQTYFSVIRSGSMMQRPEMKLSRGRSGVLVVPGNLRTIVFLKDGKEVGRQPVEVVFGEKCVVRF